VVKSLKVPDMVEEITLAGVVEGNVHRHWFTKSVQNELAKKTMVQDMAFSWRRHDVGNNRKNWTSSR
jgi:hypothetical protein